MRRPATPVRAARRGCRAWPLRKKGSRRLSLHTSSRTHKLRQPMHTAREVHLISVLALCDQRQRRAQQNVDIEQHCPVLDVVEIELDALLDLLLIVDLAAPAIDLRPAGDAGF